MIHLVDSLRKTNANICNENIEILGMDFTYPKSHLSDIPNDRVLASWRRSIVFGVAYRTIQLYPDNYLCD